MSMTRRHFSAAVGLGMAAAPFLIGDAGAQMKNVT